MAGLIPICYTASIHYPNRVDSSRPEQNEISFRYGWKSWAAFFRFITQSIQLPRYAYKSNALKNASRNAIDLDANWDTSRDQFYACQLKFN